MTDRINREHKAYADLGHQVQKIWAYFGLFEPGAYLKDETVSPPQLQNKEKGYGQGQGYRKTLGLIWFITIALIFILVILAFLKA